MDAPRIYTIELENLTLGYGDRVLIRDAGIGFGWGEFTALIGRNGTGKSTLLRTVAGLSRPKGGRIKLDGLYIDEMTFRERAAKISFVSTEVIRVANLRVTDVVGMGRAPYTDWIGTMSSQDRAVVARSLELVGMKDFAAKPLDTLSDGERQRVMIARALAQDTPVILLDEPTAFLDLPNRYQICLLLRELAHKEKKSIVFSTHDLTIALELCDTVAMIEDGQLHYGTARELMDNGSIQHLFEGTRLVFDAATGNVRLRD